MSLLNPNKRYSPDTDNRPNLIVPGEGPTDAAIMLIGERPSEREAKAGHPFTGGAGQVLNRILADAGIDRASIYLTNIVKTYEKSDHPSQFEVKIWWPELLDEIFTVRPRIIGLMGTFATETVLGVERAQLERTHGIPTQCPFSDAVCVPMFHPSAGFYNQQHMALSQYDFDTVAGLLQKLDRNEEIYDGRQDKWAGRENYGPPLSYDPIRLDCAIDTEGYKYQPWCATVSCGNGLANIYYPTTNPEHSLLVQSRRVYLHNSLHDLSVLRALGVRLNDGQFVDTMVLAYLLCLEPQGLKDLAFRHLGMEMNSYDEILGPASRDKAIEYLLGVSANEWSAAEEYVKVEKGQVKICKPHSINQRVRRILADVDADKRNKYGDPVDPRDRWNGIEDHLKQEVVEALGPMPEATLDDVPRAKAVRYACRDADATFRLAPILQEKITRDGLQVVSAIDHAIIPMIDRMQHTGMALAGEKFWLDIIEKCERRMAEQVYAIKKETGWTINPDSPKQTRELLFGKKEDNGLGLTATKFTDGNEASTKDKVLEAMYRDSPVVDMVLAYREASKIKSSYANVFLSIVRQSASASTNSNSPGRVHPNLRITRVSSGRLAANEPNLLAIPVRSELGKEIRDGFIAGPGRVLMDFDLDQIEMRWMADQSRDYGLCKIFIDGKLDVHTDTAAQMFSVGYGNVHTTQRYAAKRVGFGVITGITEYGLVDQMALARAVRPDNKPWTIDDCKRMIDEYFKIRPGVKLFMDEAGNEAERMGFVRDYWGRRRYLPGARSPIPAVAAESRRQASSHKIQAGAQGLMKHGMAAVWNDVIVVMGGMRGWEETWPVEPLLQIHDSLLSEVEEDYTWVAPMVVECLTKTVKAPRTGLPFKAKGGIGSTWKMIK